MRQWLRTYKMVDGKGENQLAYNGIVLLHVVCNLQPFQEYDAWEMVIEPNHQEWEKLIKGEVDPGKSCLDRKYKQFYYCFFIECLFVFESFDIGHMH